MSQPGTNPWTPRPEPEAVTRAREGLLSVLGRAGEKAPEDLWIRGQRIRYLAEADRWEEALELARGCSGPSPVECRGLLAFVLHGLGRYDEALAATRRSGEPAAEEEDLDHDRLSFLLDRPLASLPAEAGLSPEELRERFWSLSDPYHLAPGNDRRSAHRARVAIAGVMDGARNPYGLGWGRDLEELLVRYGWEVGWERRVAGDAGDRPVVGHHDPRARQWVPPVEVLLDPASLAPGEWTPRERSPGSGYTPPYAPEWLPLDAQLVRLRRDSALHLVAAFRLPEPAGEPGERPVRPGGPVPRIPAWVREGSWPRSGVFLIPAAGGEVLERSGLQGRTEGVLELQGPPGAYLASVEVLDASRRLGGWSRVGIRMEPLGPGGVALSDLMILRTGGEAPGSLDEAIPHLAPRPSAVAGGPVTVGWEAYGIPPGEESLEYRVVLRARDRGFLRRLGGWLGLADDGPPLALRWSEAGPGGRGAHFRTVTLAIPRVEPGTYDLELRLTLPGRDDLVSSRAVEVRVVGR